MKNMTGNRKNILGYAEAFRKDESGMGTVEVILIIVVLIALVIIFKTQITDLVNTIFESITEDANSVLS